MVDNTRTKKKLNKAQRLMLLRLCRAYRTAPTAALQVLSGVLPLHIRAKEEMWKWHLKNGGIIDNQNSEIYKYIQIGLFPNLNEYLLNTLKSNLKEEMITNKLHPSLTEDIKVTDYNDDPISQFRIFTDGSKNNSKVGSAFVVRDSKDNISYKACFKLADVCTITQAELFAILQAAKHINKTKIKNKHIKICSDSQAAIKRIVNNKGTLATLIRNEINSTNNKVTFSWIKGHSGNEGNNMADFMAKQAATSNVTPSYWEVSYIIIKNVIHNTAIQIWQREWEEGETGRTTFRFFPDISTRLRNKNFNTNFYTTQIITDHGNFQYYLHRFGHRDHPLCECDHTSIQNAYHLIFDCFKFDDQRTALERIVLEKGFNWPCPMKILVEDKDIFATLENFIKNTGALEPSFS
ncbi:uncharacterized protein LOC111642103 [Centruroides sculpturatus]|uniref:uncharacterized protein LOC111642103 n=1 Tax=Centruroides sculpturatus TaxID=218467 RepID=UPI000C6E4A7D|nr:uncharacterized protein LOC111642103 [Centruroides sculpturatus]